MYIGNHLSASKGYAAMGRMAVKLGANTFAFFTRNPRGGAAKAIDPADVEKLLELMREQQFGKLVAHAPYTMNLCAAKEDIRKFSKEIIQSNIRKEQISPKTSSFRGFLYIPINLSDTTKTHEISTVTNT